MYILSLVCSFVTLNTKSDGASFIREYYNVHGCLHMHAGSMYREAGVPDV